MKAIQIEDGEWWHKGCFIQEQNHPKLLRYHVFQDTDVQTTVGTTNSFKNAEKIAEIFEVKNYKFGAESFITLNI
jgi:hypothetical protein